MIKASNFTITLYLEVRKKAFWSKYKYEWHSEYYFRTIDDDDFNPYYEDQEFINECN